MAGKILTFSLFRYPSKSRRAAIVYDEVEPLVGELLEGCRRAVVTPVLGPQRPERSSSGELSFCSRVRSCSTADFSSGWITSHKSDLSDAETPLSSSSAHGFQLI